MYKIFFLITFTFSSLIANRLSWIGNWMALDEWKSEFNIEIIETGMAISNYGNGEKGQWKIIDGNLEIIWDSGRKDYIFSGVMGIQRLSDFKGKKYTTGMKKLLN